ncbi:TonB-linked outer membrane protein, SusC/RagA family [Pedobacter steynii]|uniref:TonB-linked outer membrane protein, SusC/RagA family n=2 Tax=Pedobacter steynii TaxID=430522 RepID=A0A1G9NJA8_9SPHI|nr:TonB-linked outer membrane protein, SusC/RagA family [Pedobacter steynii]
MTNFYNKIKKQALFTVLVFCGITAQSFAQKLHKGLVKDAFGKPVAGARIDAGTSKYPIISNKSGEFTITDTEVDTVYISKSGFLPFKQASVNIKDYSFVLLAEQNFDSRIILPWNTSVSKKYYAGAVGTTSGSEMAKYRNLNNSNALAGSIAGLITVQGSDEPGFDGSSLIIRGINTYNFGGISTYVDNVPLPFSQLDPLEIDQLSILKDATANASYGINGANKSLIVTTKRGEAYQNKINFYSQFGFIKPNAPQHYLGAKDYMTLYNEAAVNDGLPIRFTSSQIAAYDNPDRNMDQYPDVDWYKELIKTEAIQQKYNLTFSGGTNAIRYFVLLGYAKQEGLFKYGDFNEKAYQFNSNNSFDRYNFRTNIDFAITPSLTASVDLGGRIENQKSPGAGTSGTNGIWLNLSRYPPGLFPMIYSNGNIGGNSQFARNPYGIITRTGYNNIATRNLLGTTRLNQNLDKLVEGLSVTAAFSYYNLYYNGEGRTMDFASYELQPDGSYQKFGNDVSLAVRARAAAQNRLNIFWGKVDYQRTFGTKHELNASIGFNQSVNTRSGDDYPYATQGFFGRAFYNYNKKYIAELNIGYNGSENLPKGERYGLFPSLALGWIVSNENFVKSDHIDLLKLRASYGILGNADFGIGGDARSRYLYLSNYETGSAYTFGNNPASAGGRREGALGNENITWETNRMANVGIDFEFFKHRIGGSIDVFSERRKDILAYASSISSLGGFATKPFNIGIMENKGLDWDVYYKNKISDFSFAIHVLGSFVKNKIINQEEQVQPYGYLYRTGNALGTPFGLTATGYFKDQNDINNSPKQSFSTVKPGDIKYKDENNDGVIDVYDQVKLGNPNLPQFYYGLGFDFAWKGFDLKVLFQGAGSRSVSILSSAVSGFAGDNKPTDFVLNRWTPATAEVATSPRLSLGTNANNYQQSSFWMRNGRYLRLKNIELGYSLPQSLVSKVKLANARIFVNSFNLYTWSDLPLNLDPEFIGAGLGSYPRTKSFNFGLNVEF